MRPTGIARVVAYVIAGLVVGGAERQLLLLLEHLDRSRFSPHVLAFGGGSWRARFEALGIPLEVLPSRYRPSVAALWCWRRLREIRPDVVHTFGSSPNFAGRLGAVLSGVPVVIASERSAAFIKKGLLALSDRLLAPCTTRLIANSRHAARFYVEQKGFPARKAAIVENGIPFARFPPAEGSALGSELVTVGDLRREKDLPDLFQALARLGGAARLHVAGEGPLRGGLEALAARLGLGDRVIFHGYVEEVPRLLSAMDVYVHPARYEGLPNAVMEAMASGLACVACDTTGSAELITHGKTGLLVPPGDPPALARALHELIGDRALARRLGAAAREFIRSTFSLERMVERTAAVYEEALLEARALS